MVIKESSLKKTEKIFSEQNLNFLFPKQISLKNFLYNLTLIKVYKMSQIYYHPWLTNRIEQICVNLMNMFLMDPDGIENSVSVFYDMHQNIFFDTKKLRNILFNDLFFFPRSSRHVVNLFLKLCNNPSKEFTPLFMNELINYYTIFDIYNYEFDLNYIKSIIDYDQMYYNKRKFNIHIPILKLDSRQMLDQKEKDKLEKMTMIAIPKIWRMISNSIKKLLIQNEIEEKEHLEKINTRTSFQKLKFFNILNAFLKMIVYYKNAEIPSEIMQDLNKLIPSIKNLTHIETMEEVELLYIFDQYYNKNFLTFNPKLKKGIYKVINDITLLSKSGMILNNLVFLLKKQNDQIYFSKKRDKKHWDSMADDSDPETIKEGEDLKQLSLFTMPAKEEGDYEIDKFSFAFLLNQSDLVRELRTPQNGLNKIENILKTLETSYSKHVVEYPFLHDFSFSWKDKIIYLNVKTPEKIMIGSKGLLTQRERMKDYFTKNVLKKDKGLILWLEEQHLQLDDNELLEELKKRLDEICLPNNQTSKL